MTRFQQRKAVGESINTIGGELVALEDLREELDTPSQKIMDDALEHLQSAHDFLRELRIELQGD